jgi:hypothetical protein
MGWWSSPTRTKGAIKEELRPYKPHTVWVSQLMKDIKPPTITNIVGIWWNDSNNILYKE